MRLTPTASATELGIVGIALVIAGILSSASDVLSLGAALLVGIVVVRGHAATSLARARSAGFEMVWLTGSRVIPMPRLGTIELHLELRNRDDSPTWFRGLQMIGSSGLETSVSPESGEVDAHSSLLVKVELRALRVGYHGIHGLNLSAVRRPGLFEVPLTFTSPLVVSVSPRETRGTALRRTRAFAPERAGVEGNSRRPTEGENFRELREHRAGDPFRKIAWKASARRGKLLVVETETHAPETVVLLVDVSVEGFHGPVGRAPLDRGLDAVLETAERLVSRGDRVGLVLLAGRKKLSLPPGRGPKALRAIRKALATETHVLDADRSDWDEREVRDRVLSHLRTMEARADQLGRHDDEGLVALASRVERDAPIPVETPFATSAFDGHLRRYLLAFGVAGPPSSRGERHRALRQMGEVGAELIATQRRPSALHCFVFAPMPEIPLELLSAFDLARRRGVGVTIHASFPEKPAPDAVGLSALELEALHENERLQFERALANLRRRGVDLLESTQSAE